VLAFGYLINAVADRHMDEPTKNPLVTEHARGVQLQIAGLACAAMAIAALGPPVALVATTVCLVSGTLYSVGLRLKAYPLLGTLLNATNFAPLLLVGTHDGVVPPRMGWLLIAFVGLLLQNQLLHEAADSLEDARGQLATTARTLGPIKTGYAAALLGATVPAVLLRGGYGALGSMSALVFVVLFPATVARYGLDANRMGWARRAHRWASLATGAVVFAVAPAG
jgi:4-hydroxybenzoate polyprenyltransferase